MSPPKYARRVDSSQAAIVSALRQAGAFVWIIGQPVDLLVFYRGWHLLEAKPEGHKRPRKDQEDQAVFCEMFSVPVVRTPAEALVVIGAKGD